MLVLCNIYFCMTWFCYTENMAFLATTLRVLCWCNGVIIVVLTAVTCYCDIGMIPMVTG